MRSHSFPQPPEQVQQHEHQIELHVRLSFLPLRKAWAAQHCRRKAAARRRIPVGWLAVSVVPVRLDPTRVISRRKSHAVITLGDTFGCTPQSSPLTAAHKVVAFLPSKRRAAARRSHLAGWLLSYSRIDPQGSRRTAAKSRYQPRRLPGSASFLRRVPSSMLWELGLSWPPHRREISLPGINGISSLLRRACLPTNWTRTSGAHPRHFVPTSPSKTPTPTTDVLWCRWARP